MSYFKRHTKKEEGGISSKVALLFNNIYNVEFFFFELTVSFSVDSSGGDDDVVLGAGLLEDSPVDSSDTADSICCSGIIGFGELNKPRHNRQIAETSERE